MTYVPEGPRTVVVRAPTRIDLGGGWTDVPPYCDEQGGYVCNVAIDRYAVATVRDDETYAPAGATGVAANSALVQAALRRAGMHVGVNVESNFPVSAGLGGSSSVSAAVLGGLARWRGEAWDPIEIAEEGRRVEVEELGIAGGRQDHYAATHGGALGLTFTDRVEVRRLKLSPATADALERRALLVYTGESRISGSTIHAVLDAYRDRNEGVRGALAAMKSLARSMADALEGGDIDALGSLLAEHWLNQRSLHPAIPTVRIDEIVLRAHSAGALGWKAMGASGGGCVLVLCREGLVQPVRDAIAPLGSFVPFKVDRDGLSAVA